MMSELDEIPTYL